MPPKKRARETIDSTQDNHDEPPRKRQATSSETPQTLPVTNSLTSSPPLPTQNEEPELIDLTQDAENIDLTSTREPENIDLTQEPAPETELYGTLDAKIVGVRYYSGWASPGEAVVFRREPDNQYDSNAIRVDNVLHRQIGHLPRKLVEKLAPLLDAGTFTIEGQLTGEKETYDCPIRLSFYGASDLGQRAKLEETLKINKLVKSSQLSKTRKEASARRAATLGMVSGKSNAGARVRVREEPELSLEDILKASEAVELRKGWDAVKTLAMGEEQLARMPQAEPPMQLKATMLPYQLQGLAWMQAKEYPLLPAAKTDQVVQLWRRDGKRRYWNLATNFVCVHAPTLLSGGILADDMGLGKTLQVISLILAGGPGTTLIIAPVSVMSNWEQQIRRHVKEAYQPKVLIYHGSKKPPAEVLFTYDVVITSYGTLSQDMDGNKALLNQPSEWRRVVLDEGHIIRNARTKVAMAACQLKARSRWVLTGTPIVNSVKDVQSLLQFLHITGGIEQPEIFNSVISRRLASTEQNEQGGEVVLQALMQDICLRRKKEMRFVDLKLPKKTEYVHRITFRPDEKVKYDGLLSEARGMLADCQSKSHHGQKGRFQNVLERLLRLRQTCNHWTLCRERIDDLMKLLEDQSVVPLTEKNRRLLQEALRLFIDNQDDCAICYDPPTDAVITNCKHVFCRVCITKAIEIQGKCPMCRNPLKVDSLLEPAPEGTFDDKDIDPDSQSSKTEAMLQIVQATLKKEGSKLVIFSQWTSFLDIIQKQLDATELKYCRIDGSMSTEKRDRAIDALDNDAETRIMLASLAVCSVGLNLVSADTIILSDSWWAPAIEDQAVDRVHRLGQTRETTIWRLVMDGTVEERVLGIQKEKRELVSKTFQDKASGKKSKETRMADVVKLLS